MQNFKNFDQQSISFVIQIRKVEDLFNKQIKHVEESYQTVYSYDHQNYFLNLKMKLLLFAIIRN